MEGPGPERTAELDAVAEYLTRVVTNLRLRHGFDELAVVAHSMGGLVAREFILRNHDRARRDPVGLFVTISTPGIIHLFGRPQDDVDD